MEMNMEINRELAAKVLATVDAGLVKGVGVATPGQMCVEAAVCYAMGLPHGDDPVCVSRALRSLKIRLNDSAWSSDAARAKGLRRLAIAQLGSRDVLDDKEFVRRVAELAIRKMVSLALRAAASIHKDAHHKQALLDAANRCEVEGTRDSALKAKAAANAADAAYADAAYAYTAKAAYAAAYAAAAYAAAAYAAYAAAYAADADAADAYAAYAAAHAADAYAAYAAAYAADAYAADAYAAYAAAHAADAYAAYAAYAAAHAADAKAQAQDKVLSDFAEDVVQILVDMKAPGCAFLDLTE
jgi:hypothetical protein